MLPIARELLPGAARGRAGCATSCAALNRVEASAIRVNADEVTYNLHILVRFELELALLREELAVADLPEAWRERMTAIVGYTPKDDVEGVMQDIHWSWGELGYFPTYTLGNLYSAALAEAMRARPRPRRGGAHAATSAPSSTGCARRCTAAATCCAART